MATHRALLASLLLVAPPAQVSSTARGVVHPRVGLAGRVPLRWATAEAVVRMNAAARRGAAPVAVVPGRMHAPRMFSEPPPEPSADDVFDELAGELTAIQKLLQGLPLPVVQGASNSAMVLTALIAWFLTPNIGRLGTLVSVGLAGSAGRRMGDSLLEKRRKALPAAIAKLAKEQGLKKLSAKDVSRLFAKFDVTDEEAETQLGVVYGRFLEALLEEEELQTSELSQLAMLRRGLGVGWNTTEAVHTSQTKELLSGRKPPPPSKMPPVLRKLLWLSATLFATSKSQASTAAVAEAMGLEPTQVEQLMGELSSPLYKAAVTQAVGKYNRTETPVVLQKVRSSLCLPDSTADEVHNSLYDAQLSLLLPADSKESRLNEEMMTLLGELEGILQIRSAIRRLQARTLPLYRQTVVEALETVTTPDAPSSTQMMGSLAIRANELAMSGMDAKPIFIEEARRRATSLISEAAAAKQRGDDEAASAALRKTTEYCQYLGELMSKSGWEADFAAPGDLVAQYLAALSLSPEEGKVAQQLFKENQGQLSGAEEVLRSMLILFDKEFSEARNTYTARVEEFIKAGNFDSKAGEMLIHRRLTPEARRKIGLDAYYGWLLDLAESSAPPASVDAAQPKTALEAAVERAPQLRSCLEIDNLGVGELYTNTEADALVLAKCCEQLCAPGAVPSASISRRLQDVERALLARPGVLTQVVRDR